MSSGPLASVPVEDAEQLARFILTRRYVAKEGGVKAEALLPFKYVELSVTRHRDLSELSLWHAGLEVARARALPLIGRADFHARTARGHSLEVTPDEPPVNHANVIDWPAEKSAQMSLAQNLALLSTFVPYSPSNVG